MARTSKAISDILFEQAKESLKKLGRSGEAGRRLQAIISAKTMGISRVAGAFGITRMTLMAWIRNFEADATKGLTIKAGRGRKRMLSNEKEDDIRSLIQANPNITIDELKQKIHEKYALTLSRSTVHRLMKKLSFSYITPRPRHYKSKDSLKEEFKKKSTEKN